MLVRWRWMRRYNTLCVRGVDLAIIASQLKTHYILLYGLWWAQLKKVQSVQNKADVLNWNISGLVMVVWNQVVVEKKTMKEQKKTRQDLEWDQFVAEVLDNPPLFILIIFCRCWFSHYWSSHLFNRLCNCFFCCCKGLNYGCMQVKTCGYSVFSSDHPSSCMT
jgi:hypothetical protein